MKQGVCAGAVLQSTSPTLRPRPGSGVPIMLQLFPHTQHAGQPRSHYILSFHLTLGRFMLYMLHGEHRTLFELKVGSSGTLFCTSELPGGFKTHMDDGCLIACQVLPSCYTAQTCLCRLISSPPSQTGLMWHLDGVTGCAHVEHSKTALSLLGPIC